LQQQIADLQVARSNRVSLKIQAMAGHSSPRMMERYSHPEKVIDFNAMREKLDRAVGM